MPLDRLPVARKMQIDDDEKSIRLFASARRNTMHEEETNIHSQSLTNIDYGKVNTIDEYVEQPYDMHTTYRLLTLHEGTRQHQQIQSIHA